MTGYPNSPQVTKAALISMDAHDAPQQLIILQYNPERLSRSLMPVYEKSGDTPTGTDLLAGPAQETISLQARISAIDQLQAGSGMAAEFGIHPQLAALELMLFPARSEIIADVAKMAAGILEVVPPEGSLTVFVWGARRVVPVQITSFRATEILHDPRLNPIDAEVEIDLKVLTYQDFTATQKGFFLYLANLAQREVLAALSGAASAASQVSSYLKG